MVGSHVPFQENMDFDAIKNRPLNYQFKILIRIVKTKNFRGRSL